ncbi:ARM repeat-containing protein [Abortiporus biennis]|nr:ARM repeat-containing protein [Abortiporus biennis]
MEPFSSSGAMSRAHYALVRKVEMATSIHSADALLQTEVEAIQSRIVYSSLNLKQVKESLIILLYCSMTVSSGTSIDLEFALPYALSLAEAGPTVQDKRIGYLFCAEIMPKHHELQLMLVNTLRKDLERHEIPRICLALDSLLHFPPEDAAPAIQGRLYELLSHPSPHIRKRAILVHGELARSNNGILKSIVQKTIKRLDDHDPTVVSAALTVCEEMITANLISTEQFHTLLTKLLQQYWQSRRDVSKRWLLTKLLRAMKLLKPSKEDYSIILEIVQKAWTGPYGNAVKYRCFLIAAANPDTLLSTYPESGSKFIQGIRQFLTSQDVNDVYTFLCCLECLEPRLWAGTSPKIPAVLDGWEVERIMHLLESPDSIIRKKTIRILLRVDRAIVETYFKQMASNGFTALPWNQSSDTLRRPLEIMELLNGEDGENYAQQVVQMLESVDGDLSHDKPKIHQEAVEEILTYIRNAPVDFRSGCLGVLFTVLGQEQSQFGPTLLTILSALVCEYLETSPVPPIDLQRGLSRMLVRSSAGIQDVCLLTMLRVAANCDEVPTDVIATVRKLQESGGRHIRRRCEQFTSLAVSASTLRSILAQAKSSSLPDFLVALEAHYATQRQTRSPKLSSANSPRLSSLGSPKLSGLSSPDERPSSRASQSGSKQLRYAAYDAPKPTPRLRRLSSGSSTSTSHSDIPHRGSEDVLARTLTPGDLALASGNTELRELGKSPRNTTPLLPVVRVADEPDLASRVDLITLDSPFISEPPLMTSISSLIEPDFEKVWDELANANARGWCESPIDVMVRKLQGMQRQMRVTPADQPPYQGDLKIMISPSIPQDGYTGVALLRLRESEDDSCLWHLRCKDEILRTSIKSLFSGS